MLHHQVGVDNLEPGRGGVVLAVALTQGIIGIDRGGDGVTTTGENLVQDDRHLLRLPRG